MAKTANSKRKLPVALVYYSRVQGQSTVHTRDGWVQKKPFDNPGEAFNALLKRWRAGDLDARVSGGGDSDITLGIQYNFKYTLKSPQFRKAAKELYDERVEYLAGKMR
ncbi:MAG: hypothetical protein WC262_11620 [Bacteroidales bacterium]|jgi:hypothetical protein